MLSAAATLETNTAFTNAATTNQPIEATDRCKTIAKERLCFPACPGRISSCYWCKDAIDIAADLLGMP